MKFKETEIKAAIFYGKNDLRIEEIEKSTPSGTVLGHEFSGIVEAVGEGVKSVKAGDRVLVDPNKLCNECY